MASLQNSALPLIITFINVIFVSAVYNIPFYGGHPVVRENLNEAGLKLESLIENFDPWRPSLIPHPLQAPAGVSPYAYPSYQPMYGYPGHDAMMFADSPKPKKTAAEVSHAEAKKEPEQQQAEQHQPEEQNPEEHQPEEQQPEHHHEEHHHGEHHNGEHHHGEHHQAEELQAEQQQAEQQQAEQQLAEQQLAEQQLAEQQLAEQQQAEQTEQKPPEEQQHAEQQHPDAQNGSPSAESVSYETEGAKAEGSSAGNGAGSTANDGETGGESPDKTARFDVGAFGLHSPPYPYNWNEGYDYYSYPGGFYPGRQFAESNGKGEKSNSGSEGRK